jgi:hypothetical protein
MWDLEQGQGAAQIRDTYLKLLADPHVDPATVARARQAWSAFSTKPGEEERLDASNAAAGLREAGNEIVRLQGMLKDQISGTPEYAALERRLSHAEASHDAFTERVKELTGTKDTGKSKAKVVIKDRFKGAGGTDLAMNEDPNAREAAAITQSALDKETTKKPAGMINSQRRYDFRSK